MHWSCIQHMHTSIGHGVCVLKGFAHMFQVSITLPTTQHDGISNLSAIRDIKRALAKQFGGYSACPIDGGWYDSKSGQYYEESSILVWTLVENEQAVRLIKRQAASWARDLKQIELLVTVQSVNADFIAGTREKACEQVGA